MFQISEVHRRRDARAAVLARRAGWVASAGGVAVIAYWTLFFAGAVEAAPPGSVAHEFELAFPAADGLLAAAALSAGIALIRGVHAGAFFLVVAGAMSLYLGFLDVTFYARQGLYFPLSTAAGFEMFLNLFCIAGGGYGLKVGWVLWNGDWLATGSRFEAVPRRAVGVGAAVEGARGAGRWPPARSPVRKAG